MVRLTGGSLALSRGPGGRALVGVLGGLFIAGLALAQSYGLGDQTLTIEAGDLRHEFNDEIFQYDYLGADGYVYPYYDVPDVVTFFAPLGLPDGAEIERICVYSKGDGVRVVTVDLEAVKLVPPGGTAATLEFPGTVVTTDPEDGYLLRCTDPFALTLRSTIDIDGDGSPEAVDYRIRARIQNNPQSVGIGAVQIVWKRQISPPPEVATFDDVPSSDAGWAHVEALAASGITAGCGGGNFCPEATLTRRQMAVFLAKALGLQWTD